MTAIVSVIQPGSAHRLPFEPVEEAFDNCIVVTVSAAALRTQNGPRRWSTISVMFRPLDRHQRWASVARGKMGHD